MAHVSLRKWGASIDFVARVTHNKVSYFRLGPRSPDVGDSLDYSTPWDLAVKDVCNRSTQKRWVGSAQSTFWCLRVAGPFLGGRQRPHPNRFRDSQDWQETSHLTHKKGVGGDFPASLSQRGRKTQWHNLNKTGICFLFIIWDKNQSPWIACFHTMRGRKKLSKKDMHTYSQRGVLWSDLSWECLHYKRQVYVEFQISPFPSLFFFPSGKSYLLASPSPSYVPAGHVLV